MTMPATAAFPGFGESAEFARARERLTAAGYTDEALRGLVGGTGHSPPTEGAAALALAKAAGGSPLETFILLFLIGAPVGREATRRAIRPMSLRCWEQAGLIAEKEGVVRGLVRLVPFRGFWLAYDRPERKRQSDYVMGVALTTLRAMDIAIRRPVRTMLDLGSGCGTHALLAARHCGRVVASDINPRAVEFTRFNAALNDLKNIVAVGGDLFDPTAGEAFDLILSNPPFVIAAGPHRLYRDGGVPGDAFCQRLVAGAPAALETGGFCQILCNWVHSGKVDWKERLAEWFEGTGCDAWVMRVETEDAAAYAGKWIRMTETEEPAGFAEAFRRWMDHYAEQGIEEVSTGVITMRKSTQGSSWLRIDDTPPSILGPCGDDIELVFALRDFLETHPDDAQLLEMKPHVSPVVRMHQHLSPSEGSWGMANIELRREQGLGIGATIDPYVAGLVGRCDGQHTLKELIEELARAMGQDVEAVNGQALGVVRQLIENAFLVPEGIFG
jgi:SAM-dependent methyltransferase